MSAELEHRRVGGAEDEAPKGKEGQDFACSGIRGLGPSLHSMLQS